MTLKQLPIYNVFKKMAQGFVRNSDSNFQPAVLQNLEGVWELVYLVEEHGNGKALVLQTSAPTAFSGPLKVVDMTRLQVLDINLADFTKILGQWRIGSAQLKLLK